MFLVILSWIYITFIFFGLGLGVNAILLKGARQPAVMILIQGMIAAAVIASALSLFMPLSALANIFILLIAVACIFRFKQSAAQLISNWRGDVRETTRLLRVIFIAFVLVFAFLAALPPSHYDEGLYYGTTIKWIEEHGVVKGLANVNPRIGFNSTWLLLQALFNFSFLNPGHLINLNGLLLLYVFMYSLGGLNSVMRKDQRVSVIARSLFMVPLAVYHFGASSDFIFFNVNFLNSPTADLPVCMLLWLVFARLLEMDERPAQEHDPSILSIVMMSLFLFIVKPSAAPVLLTAVLFFFMYLVKRRWLMAGALCVMALLIIAPWMYRNVLVSGYLIFPFSGVDIIHADWKLPVQHVKWLENAVRVYAISPEYDLNKPFTVTVSEWFPVWWEKLSFIQSLIFIFSCASVVTFAIVFILNFFRKGQRFFSANKYFIFTMMVAAAGSLFWFMKGPDFRLGYGFAAMPVILLLSVMLRYFLERDVKFAGFVIVLYLLYILLFYYRNTFKEITRNILKPLPARRLPEKMDQVKQDNGIIMNIVPAQDSWYAPLPVADVHEFYTILPAPRGNAIKDGFKATEKK